MSTCHRSVRASGTIQDSLGYSVRSFLFSQDTILRKEKSVIAKSDYKKSESEAGSSELERVGEGSHTGCSDIAHGSLSHTH